MVATSLTAPPAQQNQEVSGPKIQHAVLLTASPLARRLLRMAFVILIARGLGPQQFGSYGLLLAILEMIAVVSGSGYVDYLTREAARDGGLAWSTASQLVLIRWAYALVFSLVGCGVLLAMRFSHALFIPAVCLFATIIPRGISEAVQGVLRGIRRYQAYLALDLVGGFILVAGGILLLIQGRSVPRGCGGTDLGLCHLCRRARLGETPPDSAYQAGRNGRSCCRGHPCSMSMSWS